MVHMSTQYGLFFYAVQLMCLHYMFNKLALYGWKASFVRLFKLQLPCTVFYIKKLIFESFSPYFPSSNLAR